MAWRKGQADQIGNLLQRWIRKNGMEDQVQRYTLQARWEEVVGPRLAARTRPDNLYRGRLKVRVEKIFPLSEVAVAHRMIENSSPAGKIILDPTLG